MKLEEEEKKKIQSPVDSTQFLQINHKNQYNAKISTNIQIQTIYVVRILPRMQLYMKINPKLIKD